MSAIGGKVDMKRDPSECLLLTQSGHWELGWYKKTELDGDGANRFIG